MNYKAELPHWIVVGGKATRASLDLEVMGRCGLKPVPLMASAGSEGLRALAGLL